MGTAVGAGGGRRTALRCGRRDCHGLRPRNDSRVKRFRLCLCQRRSHLSLRAQRGNLDGMGTAVGAGGGRRTALRCGRRDCHGLRPRNDSRVTRFRLCLCERRSHLSLRAQRGNLDGMGTAVGAGSGRRIAVGCGRRDCHGLRPRNDTRVKRFRLCHCERRSHLSLRAQRGNLDGMGTAVGAGGGRRTALRCGRRDCHGLRPRNDSRVMRVRPCLCERRSHLSLRAQRGNLDGMGTALGAGGGRRTAARCGRRDCHGLRPRNDSRVMRVRPCLCERRSHLSLRAQSGNLVDRNQRPFGWPSGIASRTRSDLSRQRGSSRSSRPQIGRALAVAFPGILALPIAGTRRGNPV